MNSNDIKALLYKKYSAPAYAFFTEVSNGTGGYHSRYADGIACGLFPSQGLEIEGFEIKSGRGDFLNEMKHPEKASEVMQFCHRWWLVAPKGVADKMELPKNWGFYEVRGNKIWKVKQAPLLDAKNPDPAFLASLFRRATEGVVPRSALGQLQNDISESTKKAFEEKYADQENRHNAFVAKVKDFQEVSGIDIDAWYGTKDVGRVVKMIMEGEIRGLHWDIQRVIEGCEAITNGVKKVEEMNVLLDLIKNRIHNE